MMNTIEAIAIGGFDGMHIGHQKLFGELDSHGAIVVIETGYANLTPGRERERYTSYPICYYALETIRHLDGGEFVRMLLRHFPKLKKIVVGYDFHFGKNRRYSFGDLRELFDGEVKVVEQVCLDDDSVHSHKIRAKLQIGDIAGANSFLGRSYLLKGEVIKGQGLGRRELVPTINLKVEGYQLPKEGIYATRTKVGDRWFDSVSFLGHRLSTDGSFAVETHLIDRDIGEVEGVIVIEFIEYLRGNQKFDTLLGLRSAIEADIEARRAMSHNLRGEK